MIGSSQPEGHPKDDFDPETAAVKGREDVQLPDGEALTADAAATITQAALARVVVLAGAVGSGKTTIVASFYQCFQNGPFLGYAFAGSSTLLGFEGRCHLSRIASEGVVADTDRTNPSEGLVYLHLRLRPTDLRAPARDLLLTDVTGERFEQARDSTEECRKLTVLKRADHVAILVDGAKLALPSERYQAKAEADMLLRSCLDAEMLGASANVDIVITKWDIVHEAHSDDTAKFADLIEKQIQERYAPRVRRLRCLRIAARPAAGSPLALGFGLDGLLPAWMEESPEQTLEIDQIPCTNIRREFNRFRMKQFSR